RRVAADAGALLVDVDAFFKSKKKLDFNSIYLDDAHYQSPLITSFISVLCTLKVAEYLLKTEKTDSYPKSVSGALMVPKFGTIDFSQTVGNGYDSQQFSNSRY